MMWGCSTSQQDYDLQEKYNQCQREVREKAKEDTLLLRW